MMEEMCVYIANLGKYNEGESVGAWFVPPVEYEELQERIGLDDQYEEYAIHDYELPFDVEEFTSLEEINRLCDLARELEDTPIANAMREIQRAFFSSFEDMAEHKDDIICYSDCEDMEDVARYFIEETGALGEIPSSLQNYIDYEAYGRDLEISGNFLVTAYGVFEYVY